MRKKIRGIYAVLHIKSGAAYIGGSTDIVGRFSWHRAMLRSDRHTSPNLQSLWNKTQERDWCFVILSIDHSHFLKTLRNKEQRWMNRWSGKKLNDRSVSGYSLSDELKQKMSLGRARFLETPGAREALSIRAKKQHANNRFKRRPR